MNTFRLLTATLFVLLLTTVSAQQQANQSTLIIGEVTTSTFNCTSCSFQHAVSGDDRLLIIGISIESGDSSKRVNSVSYAGQNLTRFAEVRGPSNDPRVDVWLLVNPPTGNETLEIFMFENNKIAITAITITGVDQTTPISGVVTGGGSEGTPLLIVPSKSGDLVIDVVSSVTDQISAGPGQTEISNLEIYDSGKRGGVSMEPGSTSVTMTWLGSEKWAAAGFSVNALGATSVSGDEQSPDEFKLNQNYPNPFNPSTTIKFALPVSSSMTLKVYNLLGIEVATLVDEYRPAGSYEVEFDASELSSGVYIYKLTTGSFTDTKKLMLLK